MRYIGTSVRGIRTPIIKGDNLEDIVIESIFRAGKEHNFDLNDRDVIGITEAVVAITQSNYISKQELTKEFKKIFPDKVGVVFPILSRNRFSLILESLAAACY